jgi:acyl-CoA reductase-like NAD-dependent aldehyde dehydrogenase
MTKPMPAHERAAILDRTAKLIEEHRDREDDLRRGRPMRRRASKPPVRSRRSRWLRSGPSSWRRSMDIGRRGGKLASHRMPIGVVGAIP